MPQRTITISTLKDGSTRIRCVTNTHPDDSEFLPEELTISHDTAEGERIFKALTRLINSTREDCDNSQK